MPATCCVMVAKTPSLSELVSSLKRWLRILAKPKHIWVSIPALTWRCSSPVSLNFFSCIMGIIIGPAYLFNKYLYLLNTYCVLGAAIITSIKTDTNPRSRQQEVLRKFMARHVLLSVSACFPGNAKKLLCLTPHDVIVCSGFWLAEGLT